MAFDRQSQFEATRKSRSVGYARVSSEEQLKGSSVDTQKASIRDRNDRDGNWELGSIYTDEGFSAYGDKSRIRPEFNRMMEDAEAGKFDVLIVDRIDRFGRESGHSIEALKILKRLGIRFVSVREPLDITNSSGMFSAGMMSLTAEQYSAIISDNVLGAVAYKTSQGKPWGRSSYGYQMCDNRCPRDDDSHPYWHLNDMKAPVVKKMFELYDTGMYSTAGIAEWLNERGHRTNGSAVDMPGAEIKGHRFTSHAISFILKNSHYIGMINDHTAPTGERPGLHAPIVEKDLFDRVQKRLKKNTVGRRTAGRKSKAPAILERIVRCYKCGSQYQVTIQGRHRGKYLRMRRTVSSPDCICMNRSFVSRHVEEDLDRFLENFTLDSNWRHKVLSELNKDSDAALIEKERKKIQEDIRRARFEYRTVKSLDDETFAAQFSTLNNRLRALQRPEVDSTVQAGELLENFGKVWREATDSEKNRLLRTIFVAINVDIDTKRVYSVVPRAVFALPIRSMERRETVALEEDSQGRQLVGEPGLTYELPTPLKIVFAYETENTSEVGQRLRDHRHAWGLTQIELEEKLNIPKGTISRFERGSTPPISMLETIYSFLAEDPPDPPFTDAQLAELDRRLRDHRHAWGLTQAELGEILGVSAYILGRCENGYIPPRQVWERLAEFLAKAPPKKRGTKAKEFGRRLRDKRLRYGMNRTEAAMLFHVDISVWRRWENGQNYPREDKLAELLEWLDAALARTLGQRIREKRIRLGMTQKELAKLLGVKKLTVRLWENNQVFPSSANLQRVMGWLHAPMRSRSSECAALIQRMSEARRRLGIGTLRLAGILGVGKNRVFEWEKGLSIPSEVSCEKILRWLNSLDEQLPTSSAA